MEQADVVARGLGDAVVSKPFAVGDQVLRVAWEAMRDPNSADAGVPNSVRDL